MLISQQIAKSQNFLCGSEIVLRNKHLSPNLNTALHEIRGKILHAHKFVIPAEIMNLDTNVVSSAEMFAKLSGAESKRDILNFAKYGKRFELYTKFARLPYKTIVLENQTGLWLLDTKEYKGRQLIHAIQVHHTGQLVPVSFEWDPTQLPAANEAEIGLDLVAPHPAFNRVTQGIFDVLRKNPSDYNGTILSVQLFAATISEILLLLNCANITIGQCKPSNKEASGIPKVFMPYYTYRILDIFRERRRYERLSDVETFLKEDAKDGERRASFVRGHFKCIREVLHWWNPFMRNRHRLDTHGFADKDYRLK